MKTDKFSRNYKEYLQKERTSTDKALCRETREEIVNSLIWDFNNRSGKEKSEKKANLLDIATVLRLETRGYIIFKLLEETPDKNIGEFKEMYETLLIRRKTSDYSGERKILDIARIQLVNEITLEDKFLEKKINYILMIEPWNDVIKATIQKITELQVKKIIPEQSVMKRNLNLLLQKESWGNAIKTVIVEVESLPTTKEDLLKIDWTRIVEIVKSFEDLTTLNPGLKPALEDLLELADKIGNGLKK